MKSCFPFLAQATALGSQKGNNKSGGLKGSLSSGPDAVTNWVLLDKSCNHPQPVSLLIKGYSSKVQSLFSPPVDLGNFERTQMPGTESESLGV